MSSSQKKPWYALHPLAGIFWATFLGGILGGCILMAINYSRVQRSLAAVATVVIGLLSSLLIHLLLVLLQLSWGSVGLLGLLLVSAVQALVFVIVAFQLQDRTIERHRLLGGHIASPCLGACIGAACSVLASAVLTILT